MEAPRHITVSTNDALSRSESLGKDRADCWRLITGVATMHKIDPVHVNGQFDLNEMAWTVEIYESTLPEHANDVGLHIGQVLFKKDISYKPTAILLLHLRGQSFRQIWQDLLTMPSLRLSLSFRVDGLIYDPETDKTRWLTSKAPQLTIPSLQIRSSA